MSGARRQRRGFQRAGALRLDQLGLAARQAQDLVLARAWRAVAGETVALRAPVLRLQRGVLELEVADSRWETTLVELAPRLVGRLATRHPELAIRRFRFRRPLEDRAERARELSFSAEAPPEPLVPSARGSTPGSANVEPVGRRLEQVSDRYLDRVAARAPQKP